MSGVQGTLPDFMHASDEPVNEKACVKARWFVQPSCAECGVRLRMEYGKQQCVHCGAWNEVVEWSGQSR